MIFLDRYEGKYALIEEDGAIKKQKPEEKNSSGCKIACLIND